MSDVGISTTIRVLVVFFALIAVTACGGGASSTTPIPVSISVQSHPVSAVSGTSASFSITAIGDSLSFQWQLSTDHEVTWNNISGATAATYVITTVSASMNGNEYRAVVTGASGSVTSSPVTLTVTIPKLLSRLGGAAYYDSELDATIIGDANLPTSQPLGISNIAADGTMSWDVAKAWVQALNTANYLGYSDWRLPTVTPINGSSFQFNNDPNNPNSGYDGTMDLGYNISAQGTAYAGSTASELPFLFYNSLGSIADTSPLRVAQDNTINTNAPLLNVALGPYWTATPYSTDGAFAFNFKTGTQYAYVASTPGNPNAGWHFNVIVLRSGDSAD